MADPVSLKFQRVQLRHPNKQRQENFKTEILNIKSSNTNETLGHMKLHCDLNFSETPKSYINIFLHMFFRSTQG